MLRLKLQAVLAACAEYASAHTLRAEHFSQTTDSRCSRAQAVIELQRVLPKARIMYVSATGATDPEVLSAEHAATLMCDQSTSATALM